MKKDTEAKKPEKLEKSGKDIGKRLKIGSLLVFLFFLLYIPSLLNWLNGNNVVSDILRIGTIEDSINADSVVIRDEVLLEASAFEGEYIPEALEGEKVPASHRVATVLNKASNSLLKELDEVNLKIVEARENSEKKADFFSEDTAKLDVQISQKVQDMIAVTNSSSLADIARIRGEIDKLIAKKSEITGGDGNDKIIKPLLQQKTEIQNRINSNTKQIISVFSGIISYAIDGYEQILTPKAIKGLTPELLEGIKINAGASPDENLAHANKPFVKVIRGSEIYIATVLDQSEAGKYKEGDEIGIRINDTGMETKATVAGISKPAGGKCVMTVRTNRGVDELSSMRRINVDFIRNSDEGLKVPVKCLRKISPDWSSAEMMLIKANVAVARRVDIVCRDEEYAIIKTPQQEVKKTVSLYDTYILNPENVKEGDIIGK
jgi:putative membrane fusion protein